MTIITNKSEITDVIKNLIRPALLRFDESYFQDIDLIHCIIKIDNLNIYNLNELMDLNIDESLLKETSKLLIYRYIDWESWNLIAIKMFISLSTLKRWHKIALQSIRFE